MVPHKVHRRAQRPPPLLVGTAPNPAAAVRTPSLDAVSAAPSRGRIDFKASRCRMGRQKCVTIGDDNVAMRFEEFDRPRQFGGTAALMMPEGFTVSRDQ